MEQNTNDSIDKSGTGRSKSFGRGRGILAVIESEMSKRPEALRGAAEKDSGASRGQGCPEDRQTPGQGDRFRLDFEESEAHPLLTLGEMQYLMGQTQPPPTLSYFTDRADPWTGQNPKGEEVKRFQVERQPTGDRWADNRADWKGQNPKAEQEQRLFEFGMYPPTREDGQTQVQTPPSANNRREDSWKGPGQGPLAEQEPRHTQVGRQPSTQGKSQLHFEAQTQLQTPPSQSSFTKADTTSTEGRWHPLSEEQTLMHLTPKISGTGPGTGNQKGQDRKALRQETKHSQGGKQPSKGDKHQQAQTLGRPHPSRSSFTNSGAVDETKRRQAMQKAKQSLCNRGGKVSTNKPSPHHQGLRRPFTAPDQGTAGLGTSGVPGSKSQRRTVVQTGDTFKITTKGGPKSPRSPTADGGKVTPNKEGKSHKPKKTSKTKDYKAILREYSQKRFGQEPVYDTTSSGKNFVCLVVVGDKQYGSWDVADTGEEAEQLAAENACADLGYSSGETSSPESPITEDELKDRVRHIMEGRDNGIWLEAFAKVYEEKYHHSLPGDFHDLVLRWNDVIQVEDCATVAGRKILYPVTQPQTSLGHDDRNPPDKQSKHTQEATSSTQPDRDSHRLPVLQNDVIQHVHVSHVTWNGVFYIHIRGPGLRALQIMMLSLAAKYSQMDKAQLPAEPEVGELYILENAEDSLWYRVEVVQLHPDHMVEVYYSDYGCVDMVSVRQLQEADGSIADVMKLPRQAVPCTLHTIPSGDHWTLKMLEDLERVIGDTTKMPLKVIVPATKEEIAQVMLYTTSQDGEMVPIDEKLRTSGTDAKPDNLVPSQMATIAEGCENENTVADSSGKLSGSEPQRGSLGATTKALVRGTSKEDNEVKGDIATPPCRQKDKGLNEPLRSSATSDNSLTKPAEKSISVSGPETPSRGQNEKLQYPPTGGSTSSMTSLTTSVSSLDRQSSSSLSSVMSERTKRYYHKLPIPPSVDLPDPRTFFDVHVSWVCDPTDMACSPDESLEDLKFLMGEMYQLYETRGHVTLQDVCPNQLYAVKHDDLWHRVLVPANQRTSSASSDADKTFVTVEFVDTGESGLLPVSHLQPLPGAFRELPLQAIQIELADVVSFGSTWSDECESRLSELVQDKEFVAFIKEVDVKSTRAKVVLIDTSMEDTDIIINDVLVQEGLARQP